jgi:hypothetical protein
VAALTLRFCFVTLRTHMRFAELPKRIKDKIEVEPFSGCWLWIGALFLSGYGKMMVGGKMVRAHRLVYELDHEPVQSLHHRCETKCCVNPAHLEPIDHAVHILGHNLRRTHCKNGHLLRTENLVASKHQVICRICHNENARRFRRRQGVPTKAESTAKRPRRQGRFIQSLGKASTMRLI